MDIKKTKIVATIGPASQNEKVLRELIINGVNVCRLNFSHGNLVQKKEAIDLIRKVSEKIKIPVAILADLPGPKIRLGEIDGVFKIKKGDVLTFGTNGKTHLPIQFDFTKDVSAGQKMYLNDALISLNIINSKDGVVTAKALNSGWVTSRKGINLPETLFERNIFTDEDRTSALFAIKENVDFIALSFIQSGKDILPLRKLIDDHKSKIKIITKVEKPQAIKNIEEIINLSDAVMVARGDLAIETSPAEVPLMQQKIISLARQSQKPVIVATQMLESMIENPRPTRAEASDVANAVLSQVDAVMLSAESASGNYPVETVKTMKSIIETVEKDLESKRYIRINWEKININDLNFNAIVSASASLAYRLKSPVIGIGTVSGKTVKQLSSFRPSADIVAFTHNQTIARQLLLSWGVNPILISKDVDAHGFETEMINTIKKSRMARKGTKVVLIWGSKIGVSSTTDTIKVVAI
ncbi:MAG: pyruvate kinase [Microgenomates group bacterium]